MPRPSFKQALYFWMKLGFISFGGPAGQIAIMHEYLVSKEKWISESKFMHALNYCMVLPGPEAQQLATYIGWMLHGTRGGLAAGILFVLPSMFILIGLGSVYVTYGNIPWIYAMFDGLKPSVIAIVILALIKIGKKSLAGPFSYFIALAAFIGIFFLNIPFPAIILGAIFLGLVAYKWFPKVLQSKKTDELEASDEEGYFINKHSTPPQMGFKFSRVLRQVFIACILWAIPLVTLYLFSEDFLFWKELSLFFTKAAFVTFGGAYAVLPYVAQVSVEKFHWLSELQMIDGLALGETTPGPLVMVLAFVGFMAGFNHFSSLFLGTLALVVTTFYTFLPCFLFILIGGPIIERSQENNRIKLVLSLVTAAVVGVILNLTLYLGKAVLFSGSQLNIGALDIMNLIWIIISIIALYRFKVNMILWIGISALFGLLVHLFSI